MAFIKFFLFLFWVIISLYHLYAAAAANSFHPLSPDIHMLRSCNIDKIYQLGDSLSDTGNWLRENPSSQCSNFPYGESFFKEPTGRCSDGLLMIDYIASAIGIPFLNPYKNVNANFTHGVNFAVGGATALSVYNLAEKNVILSATNSSLGVQLDWMDTYFASLCKSDKGCITEKLKNALFMVGEIGGNDYNFALQQGKTIEENKSLVPEVIQVIMDAVRCGAEQSTGPLGCEPKVGGCPQYGTKSLQHQCRLRQYKAMSGARRAMFGRSFGVSARCAPVGARCVPVGARCASVGARGAPVAARGAPVSV